MGGKCSAVNNISARPKHPHPGRHGFGKGTRGPALVVHNLVVKAKVPALVPPAAYQQAAHTRQNPFGPGSSTDTVFNHAANNYATSKAAGASTGGEGTKAILCSRAGRQQRLGQADSGDEHGGQHNHARDRDRDRKGVARSRSRRRRSKSGKSRRRRSRSSSSSGWVRKMLKSAFKKR